jgi:GAF domain-containing protein
LNIPDVYELSADFPFQFNPEFDLRNNYHTQSILAVPLKDHTGKVIGVLELINAMDDKGESVPFSEVHENLVLSLASLAAVAINKARLIQTFKTCSKRAGKNSPPGGHVPSVNEYRRS